jgi:hypothetical protein
LDLGIGEHRADTLILSGLDEGVADLNIEARPSTGTSRTIMRSASEATSDRISDMAAS